jgi:hypothetical protein
MSSSLRFLGSIPSHVLDEIHLSEFDCNSIGIALENTKRINEIAPFASGSSLYDSLQSEGFFNVRLFLDWWLSEDNFSRLNSFMEEEFPGRSELLEKQGSHSFRYRIRRSVVDVLLTGSPTDPSGSGKGVNNTINNNRSNENLRNASSPMIPLGRRSLLRQSKNYSNPLIEIFEKLEIKKRSLNVQEYSVGQTTLEQIFNHFASKQDNPEIAVLNHQQQLEHQQQKLHFSSSSNAAVNPSNAISEKNILDSPVKLRHTGSRDTASSLEGESDNNKGGSKKPPRFLSVESSRGSPDIYKQNDNGILRNNSNDEEQGSPVEIFEYFKNTDDDQN